MKIIKPPKLQKGDAVGIVSPSSPITKELMKQFDEGVRVLKEEFGLKVKYTDRVFDKHFYNAGTRENRIKDFNEMWSDSEVKMVLMSLGGHTANHLLDGIDYEIIKNNPKIFAGISDGTTLVNAIFAKTGLVTYHGPDLLFTFGQLITGQIKRNFFKTFFEGEVGKIEPNKNWIHQEDKTIKNPCWNILRGGKTSGILIGGHSQILVNLVASNYAPDFENKILFLEGTTKDYDVDRELTTLKLAGVFDKINGLILGWFEDFENEGKDRRPIADIVLEVTKDYNFPILEISDLGHNVENYTFPIGCRATIDADNKVISIDEKTVL